MKAIFTFIQILIFVVCGFSQELTSINVKTSLSSSVERQLFSISKIYPNPAKDIVNVDLQISSEGNIQIELYNILGVAVKTWKNIFVLPENQQIQLDLSSFKSGVYILKVKMNDKVCSQVLKKS